VQNAAARLVFQESKFCRITPLLRSLHWLPVKYSIDFKILLLTFKAIHKIAPDYISNLISLKGSTRYSFRSSNTMLLSVPSGKSLKTLGDRAFGIKKIPVVPVPDRPYFFLPTLLFFQHDLTVQPYFLRVVACCCQNGACCHTNYWKNMKKYIISDLPTLIFSRYETGTTRFFLRLWHGSSCTVEHFAISY
jgi:hypothetical protein